MYTMRINALHICINLCVIMYLTWQDCHVLTYWPAPVAITCTVCHCHHTTAGLMESTVEVLRNLHSKLCMESLDGGKKKVHKYKPVILCATV